MKGRFLVRVAVCAAVAAGSVTYGQGQQGADPAAVQKRLEALEAQQRVIQMQLEEIKALITAARQPAPARPGPVENLQGPEVDVAAAAARGQASAKFVMVEFSDFQCPFCGRYAREAYGPLIKEFVDTGQVRYVFKHLPLDVIHPQALKAAEASECARDQGKFWEMRDVLFLNQQALDPASLVRHAQTIGLDNATFQSCMGGRMAARVRQDVDDAARLGADSTPSFFIGQVQPSGKVRLLRRISGSLPYATFKGVLQGLLATPATK